MGSVTQYHCDKCGIEFPRLVNILTYQISSAVNEGNLSVAYILMTK